jgi:iron(III) transport system substrate-binding protein
MDGPSRSTNNVRRGLVASGSRGLTPLRLLVTALSLLAVLGTACGPSAPRPAASAPRPESATAPAANHAPTNPEWEQLVSRARQEGKVTIISAPGDAFRRAVEQFKATYPWLDLDVRGEHIRDTLPRILREREADIYSTDVMIGAIGAGVFQDWIPRGVLDPLEPTIVLPELKDDNIWHGGFADGWMDSGQKYVFAFVKNRNTHGYVNRDVIPERDLPAPVSTAELANPRWKGKIVWDDPRELGTGVSTLTGILQLTNEDFVRRLLRDQEVVVSRDPRQIAEWNVRGSYPIAIGVLENQLVQFREQGLGLNLAPLRIQGVDSAGPGYGTVALFNKAPHPNAAALFVNWLLSNEGQTVYTRISAENSRRTDVPPGNEKVAVEPGVKYIIPQHEEFAAVRSRAAELAREAIR